jgi:hypothetical protein
VSLGWVCDNVKELVRRAVSRSVQVLIRAERCWLGVSDVVNSIVGRPVSRTIELATVTNVQLEAPISVVHPNDACANVTPLLHLNVVSTCRRTSARVC